MGAVAAIASLLVKEVFRKKDFYVAFILMAVVLAYAASLRFYDVRNVTRYLLELGLSLVFFFSAVLTVSLGARQMPAERAQRTLAVLLAKPVTRAQVLLGKFSGTFAASASAFTCFFAAFVAVAVWRGAPLDRVTLAQTYACFLLGLGVLSAMAVGLSHYLTTSANVTLTLVLYLMINLYGPSLKELGAPLAPPLRWAATALYYGMPHFEFFDLRQRLVHGWGPVSPKLAAFLAAYAVCYAAAFLALGWLRLRRERL